MKKEYNPATPTATHPSIYVHGRLQKDDIFWDSNCLHCMKRGCNQKKEMAKTKGKDKIKVYLYLYRKWLIKASLWGWTMTRNVE